MYDNDENLNTGLRIHLDYLSFTFPLEIDENETPIQAFEKYKQDLCDLFYMSIDQYGEVYQYYMNGYENQISLGQNIRVRFGGISTMMKATLDPVNNIKSEEKYESCQVELKGQACREIEFLSNGNIDYLEIFNYFLYERKGRCTRIDIAIDDFDGNVINIEYLDKKIFKREYTSSFRTNTKPPLNQKALGDLDNTNGWSLYFGKASGQHKSNKELCIYNKLAERLFHKDDLGINYYVRYEMRFRNEYADEVCFYLLNNSVEDIGLFAREQLFNMLKLRQCTIGHVITNDNNISRWDIDSRWIRFLNLIDALKLKQRPILEPTIEIKRNWNSTNITRQEIIFEIADVYDGQDNYADQSFAMLINKIEDKLNWFKDHVFTNGDLQAINNYRKRKYYKEMKEKGFSSTSLLNNLTMEDIEKYKKNLTERLNYFKEFEFPF